jgi:hypothetical protein
MAEIVSSAEVKRMAGQALSAEQVILQTDTYFIYRLPQNQNTMLENFVLLLFNTGHDFPADKVPAGLIIPVDIDNRRGYLLEENVASNFQV